MNKNIKNSVWTMAIAIAGMTMTACSLDSVEPEKPFTTCPESETRLFVRGYCTLPTGLSEGGVYEVFTEDDIEWFDVNTRELRFRDMEEPLCEKLRLLSGVEFHLGDQTLFSGSTFVGLICSQFFDDLVLCCGNIEDDEVVDDGHYYLYDCYPPQFADDEHVQAYRARRAEQWETFTTYLESKGKLKE